MSTGPKELTTLSEHEAALVELGSYMVTDKGEDPAVLGRLIARVINGIPAVRGAIASLVELDPTTCQIPVAHHHQVASGMSVQFQPKHPIAEVPERYR